MASRISASIIIRYCGGDGGGFLGVKWDLLGIRGSSLADGQLWYTGGGSSLVGYSDHFVLVVESATAGQEEVSSSSTFPS